MKTAATAATQSVQPPPTAATMSGTVTSASTNSGISGALVSLSTGGKHNAKFNTSTNSTGGYSLANLTPASYSSSGYTSQKLSLTLTGGTTTINVSLNVCTARRCK
jgi:hypothetical protein